MERSPTPSPNPHPSDSLSLIDFRPKDAAAFRQLNHEWITRYFQLEQNDHKSLDHPQKAIIDPGGAILMALYKGETVGTCALVKESDTLYELAKMAVTPSAQGLGIGRRLGEAVLAKARELGAKRVYLVSNRKLAPAINLYVKLGFVEVAHNSSNDGYARSDIRMEVEV